ncbi:MAG: hypothetical protein JWR16_2431 [Nevskia sp.]|nr:hypothetical protein [Nevskia sp.]
MNVKPVVILIVALLTTSLIGPPAAAQSSGKPQYISDDISVTLREKPSNDAAPLGALKSGARVTVLEVLGADSFARVRTADGREGWITARYISDQPAAKDQLLQLRQQLQESSSQIQNLQRDLQAAQQQLTKAKPALDMAADNDKLRATIAERERVAGELEHRFDEEKAHRQTLITGAALAGGGVFVGLVLPWLAGGSRRRRYKDLA